MEDFSPKGGDWGAMNWHNLDLANALVKLNENQNDNPENPALRQQISQILIDERPVTPVLYYQQNVATGKALKGVEIDPFERHFYLNKLSW